MKLITDLTKLEDHIPYQQFAKKFYKSCLDYQREESIIEGKFSAGHENFKYWNQVIYS